jgi:autotransporter-associated beta strand protein
MRKEYRGPLRQRRLSLIVAAALGLSACGGGGGNVRPTATAPAAPPAVTPTAPPPPPIDAHLALTDTYAAHAEGYTGAGVVIGMVDTGINPDHPALQGRVEKLLVYVDPATNDTSKGDVVGHGTWTSQVAAGVPVGPWPGGIAPGAELVSARIINDKAPADDGSGQGNKVETTDADFFGKYVNPDLIASGVQVMNNSWGGLYWDPANSAAVGAAFGAAYRPFVIDHGGLVVFATGNDGGTQPSDTAAIPYWAPDLEKGWLAVAALDSLHPTQLASYSNACGKAMNYCLVAPGDVIVTGANDTATSTSYYVVSGTSFAAPAVSGAAALVWQAFPYFSNDLVRQTLLGTAKDLGAPGVDPVFGYGLLDVGRAVNGPAQFNWGDVSVGFSGSSTWSNAISGAGGLIKQGDGTLTLSAPSSYTGLTQVQGGTLVASSLAGSVSIGAQGTLSHANVQGSVGNAGVLDIGSGGASIAGNYSQQGNGRLSLSLGSSLSVGGTATLAGGDLYVAGVNSGYTVNSHTAVLSAAGGLNGTFSALNSAPSVLLTATLNYDATSAWLNVQQVSVTSVQGLSSASFGAAQRVQGAFEQINSQLAATTTSGSPAVGSGFVSGAASLQHASSLAAVQQSLQSLSGQLHAASAEMTFEAIDAGTRALSDRFDHLLDAPQASAWTQNLGYHGDMSRSGYNSVGYDLSGWMSGADRRFGSNLVAGYALSQSQGLGRLDESADQGRSRAMEAMFYGGMIQGAWYAMGRVGVGHYREDMHRGLQLGGQSAGVSSDSDGRYDVAYGESGYRFALGGMQVTPYANVQYASIQRDGFNELGGDGFGLKAAAQNVERWQAGVGMRTSQRWTLAGGGRLELQTHLSWQQAFAMHGDVFEASFAALDQWSPVGGIGLSRYGGVAGASLGWTMSPRGSLQIGIDQYLGQRQQARMATLDYRLSF